MEVVMSRIQGFDELMSRVAWFGLAVLILTTVHHIYGAYVYDTPWRLHVGFVSVFAAAAIAASLFATRRAVNQVVRDFAFWVFVIVSLVVPVLLIGLFEGGYNHVLKDAMFFAGLPTSIFDRLFPPPMYEKPDDLFFEITGVMQLFPGALTGWWLYRLVRQRSSARSRRTYDARANVVNA